MRQQVKDARDQCARVRNSSQSRQARKGRPMRIAWNGTAIICSMALAILLVGCGSASAAPTPTRTVTPTATIEPAAQAYLSLLRTYYVPMATANFASRDCFLSVRATSTAQQLATCKTPVAAELAAGQTLVIQLGNVTPPARWQAQHTALRQAMPGVVALTTTQLKAIEANDVSGYLNTNHQAHDALLLFCDPITQINAGPPPVSPPLPVPDPLICNGG